VDPTVSFSVVDLALGVTSNYRPWQVALGSAALWSMVVVLGSTAVSASLSYGVWRNLHFLSFPAYGFALVHGLTAGTDASSTMGLALYASTAAVVAAFLVARVFGRGWVGATAG
jgi:sulfoxide reductase heme-binding subunit YedZ